MPNHHETPDETKLDELLLSAQRHIGSYSPPIPPLVARWRARRRSAPLVLSVALAAVVLGVVGWLVSRAPERENSVQTASPGSTNQGGPGSTHPSEAGGRGDREPVVPWYTARATGTPGVVVLEFAGAPSLTADPVCGQEYEAVLEGKAGTSYVVTIRALPSPELPPDLGCPAGGVVRDVTVTLPEPAGSLVDGFDGTVRQVQPVSGD